MECMIGWILWIWTMEINVDCIANVSFYHEKKYDECANFLIDNHDPLARNDLN